MLRAELVTEQKLFLHVPLGGSHCIHESTVTSSSKPLLVRACPVLCRFASHSSTRRIALSCFIRFTPICHFAVILQLFPGRVFLSHGWHSINTCGTELTSLSALFLLPEQKCPEKLELTFLFFKQPPTSANNVQNWAPASTP